MGAGLSGSWKLNELNSWDAGVLSSSFVEAVVMLRLPNLTWVSARVSYSPSSRPASTHGVLAPAPRIVIHIAQIIFEFGVVHLGCLGQWP